MRRSAVLFLCGVLIASLACHRALSRARSEIDRGNLEEAERILMAEVDRHPSDPEVHLLLGEVYLRQGRTEAARQQFLFLRGDPTAAARIRAAYQAAAEGRHDAAFTAEFVSRATADPAEKCAALIALARKEDSARSYAAVIRKMAQAGAPCTRRVATLITGWLSRHPDEIGVIADVRDSSALTAQIAIALRDAAAIRVRDDVVAARRLLDEALRLDPSLTWSGATQQVLAQFPQRFGPSAAAMRNNYDDMINGLHSGDPLHVTEKVITYLTYGLQFFYTDYHRYPDQDEIELAIVPRYIPKMVRLDGWGHELVFLVSRDGSHARVVSAGADGKFSPESLDINLSGGPRVVSDPNADIIWEDGQMIQFPRSSQ